MDKYRNTSTHPEDLADGRVLGVGDEAEVDASDPHNAVLVEDGRMTLVPDRDEPEPSEAAIKAAGEADMDITSIAGTGKDGRVTVEDVKAAAEQQKEGEDE